MFQIEGLENLVNFGMLDYIEIPLETFFLKVSWMYNLI